ncbi:3-carboxy-cis,cis-muconate cycloisomerase [Telmatospirillum siberiense]|uniref:3-carboxy-cis,cis-muconate cycloisomerase n=2 Tax=Telmatospirillum siberiense TaxID=382514 RepID=A0A2N3PV20_9PROT|nr:3-carboxy-cis,cis-muconate cycloisomerase [Telmatospirillum siberiense]
MDEGKSRARGNGRELLDPLFVSVRLREVFSDHGRLQAMLEVEAALARAEARCGIVPAAAAAAIAACCRAEAFDVGQLAEAAGRAGNPAIPLVMALTALVGDRNAEAAAFVHWGATSQDVMDSGLILQLREVLRHIEGGLEQLSGLLADMAERHRGTLIAGRTWLQQAQPSTFGLKAAGWLSANERHRARLAEIRPRLLVLQFGGAVGTLASLGERGMAVAAALAEELGLALPDLPWHSQRDRLAELAAVLGLLVGSLGKVARDISLLMQTEVGEVFEPAGPGRGGSSAMPHKRNPVASASVLAAAIRVPGLVSTMLAAMIQEHERGLGNWLAEWETLPEICVLAGGAVEQMAAVLEGLEIDAERMRDNIGLTHGLIFSASAAMALAPHLGARAAHAVVEDCSRRAIAEDRELRDVLAGHPAVRAHLTEAGLDALFDPAKSLGLAGVYVDRVLAAWRERR